MNVNVLAKTIVPLPIIAVLALAGCGGGGGGDSAGVPQLPDTGLPVELSQFLRPATDQGAAPGMIAAIIDGNGVRAIGAAGVRRQGSPETITIDDLVRIGSDTKAMTSTMLATLVKEGTFANGWNTTIAEVFPELTGTIHQDYNAVTLSQLVRMQSGIARNPASWDAYANNPDIVDRRYNILRDNLANPAPGRTVGQYAYSNLSYMVAGAMAERLTGKSWETLMQERLFVPLQIATFGYGPPGTPGGADQPWGHRPDGTGGWTPFQDSESATGAPAGSNLHMSIEDWAKFISLWFADKAPAILDRSTLIELSTPVSDNYAAGWRVIRQYWAGGAALRHVGIAGGWRAYVLIAPDRGLAYVVVVNASDQDRSVEESVHAIVASFVTSEDLPGGRGSKTPGDHVVQLAQDNGISVAALRNEDGDLTGLMVGNTAVSRDFHRLGNVRGTLQRPTVGSILQNNDIRIRHIDSHWNRTTDVVSRFEHLSYGAWSTVAPETGGNADFDHRFESIGSGYLVALDEARTPTADMPMTGTATYMGQYTGFIHGHGASGLLAKSDGDVEMTADFVNAAMKVDIVSTRGGKLVLSGAIQGNEFSGTTIDQMGVGSLIEAQGATASFSGGFYGNAAVEAGGVFEVVGGRAQDPGRLVGAFGGRRDQ